MSLINDALKKAQRQRGDETPGEIAGPGPSRVARRDKPTSFSTLLMRVGVGIVAVCAIIVTTVVLVRKPDAPTTTVPPATNPAPANPTPTTPAANDQVAANPVAPKSDTPATTTPPVTTPEPAPSTPAAQPTTTVAATTPEPAGPIQVPNLTLPPVTEPASLPAPTNAAEQDKRILAYLANLRVNMIRPAGADSKVLMNDRVYRLNDVVDYTLGLKVTGIATQRLDFVDERGVAYVKTF